MIAPYARKDAGAIAVAGGAIAFLVGYFLGWWALVPGVLTVALLMFYRDPPRRVPKGDDLVLAAADGRIYNVDRDVPAEEGAGREVRIIIFLSVLDVHVNRMPCAGRVTAVRYRPGEFLNALKQESHERNERNTLTLQPRGPLPGPIHVRQIAGGLARRIVCVAKPEDGFEAGERFGMIKLGSRTEIRVPEDPRWEILVRPGDRVYGGITVVARLRPA